VGGGAPLDQTEAAPWPHSRARSSCKNLREWYSNGLQSKVAQAAREGRVDAEQAAELHRLMTDLLESRSRIR
jgi:hypothetical protein